MKTLKAIVPARRGIIVIGVLLFFTAGSMNAQHPLDSWVQRAVPAPSAGLNSVAFGNGIFVAVGDASFVTRSTDGETWTTSTAGAYGKLKRVRFLNGQFMAVGASDKLIYSTDGSSWNSTTLPQADFWDIAWGNGVYVLAGSSTLVSSDGINWDQVHPIADYGPGASFETLLDTVVFGDSGFMALPLGLGPFGMQKPSMSSNNGVDWTRGGQAPAGGGGSGELIFNNGLWLANTPGDFGYSGVYVSSNGGDLWTSTSPGGGLPGGAGLAAGQGNYLWIQQSFVTVPYTSTNGSDWIPHDAIPGPVSVRSATFGNGTFVVVGVDGAGTSSFVLQSGNVGGEPILFTQPEDRGAVVSNPATFTVQAVGAPPLIYQWYKNGNSIPGATNSAYTISSVQANDGGGYHVVITNSFGSVTSRVAQLTVAFLDIHSYTGVTVLGVPGRTYRIEATPAAGTPNWQTVTNLVLLHSPYIWIDYDSPTVPSRLYRAAELP